MPGMGDKQGGGAKPEMTSAIRNLRINWKYQSKSCKTTENLQIANEETKLQKLIKKLVAIICIARTPFQMIHPSL